MIQCIHIALLKKQNPKKTKSQLLFFVVKMLLFSFHVRLKDLSLLLKSSLFRYMVASRCLRSQQQIKVHVFVTFCAQFSLLASDVTSLTLQLP